MISEPPAFQLREPSGADALLPEWWLPHILIGSTLLIAVLLIAVLLFRAMKRPRPESPGKIREQARLQAATDLNTASQSASTPRDAAIQASLILRKYLSTAIGDPALFETHEEFIARHDSLAALTPQARASAASGFSGLAAIKYAAAPPEGNPTPVLEAARTLLADLHRGFSET